MNHLIKKCLMTFVILCCIVTMFNISTFAKEYDAMQIEVSTVAVDPGDEAKVIISLKNNPGISSLKFDVYYDNLLSLKNIEFNKIFGENVTTPKPYSNPQALSFINPTKDIKYDGTFAVLYFKVSNKAKKGYKANISIKYDSENIFDSQFNNIPVEITDGEIEIYNDNNLKFLIAFDSNGGNDISTGKVVSVNDELGELPIPVRNGYDFVGWTDSKDGGKFYYADSTVESTDTTTLFAQWVKSGSSYVKRVFMDDIEIKTNEEFAIKPKIEVNGDPKYTVTYNSKDSTVAEVNENGNLIGKKSGCSEITCSVTDENGIIQQTSFIVIVKNNIILFLLICGVPLTLLTIIIVFVVKKGRKDS